MRITHRVAEQPKAQQIQPEIAVKVKVRVKHFTPDFCEVEKVKTLFLCSGCESPPHSLKQKPVDWGTDDWHEVQKPEEDERKLVPEQVSFARWVGVEVGGTPWCA